MDNNQAQNVECEPTGAWVEVVNHPAIGDPTIIIDNPDYVPATEGYYATEPNPDYVPATPDTTEVVHHEAVTVTHWKYVKNGGPGEVWLDYYQHGKIKIDGDWYQATNKTKEVVIKDAWDEEVLVPGNPAQGEPTIEVWVDGVPAKGEPTIKVANPDHTPAWTELIEHDAIECEVAPVVDQVIPKPDVVAPGVPELTTTTLTAPAGTEPVGAEALAETGGADLLAPLTLLAAVLIAGGACLLRSARARLS